LARPRQDIPIIGADMRTKIVLGMGCAALAVIVAFTQYIHTGYVGVIGSRDHVRVMGHGPHLRAPWAPVALYPIRPHEIAIKNSSEGPGGKCSFEVSLQLAVLPDSVADLHRAFQGKYVESLVTPVMTDFLLRRGNASGSWFEGECEEIGKEMAAHLNSRLGQYGIVIYAAWLRSFEISRPSEPLGS
jgi:hypothetical protein